MSDNKKIFEKITEYLNKLNLSGFVFKIIELFMVFYLCFHI